MLGLAGAASAATPQAGSSAARRPRTGPSPAGRARPRGGPLLRSTFSPMLVSPPHALPRHGAGRDRPAGGGDRRCAAPPVSRRWAVISHLTRPHRNGPVPVLFAITPDWRAGSEVIEKSLERAREERGWTGAMNLWPASRGRRVSDRRYSTRGTVGDPGAGGWHPDGGVWPMPPLFLALSPAFGAQAALLPPVEHVFDGRGRPGAAARGAHASGGELRPRSRAGSSPPAADVVDHRQHVGGVPVGLPRQDRATAPRRPRRGSCGCPATPRALAAASASLVRAEIRARSFSASAA